MLLKDTFVQWYFLVSIQCSSRTLYAPKGLFMFLKDTFLAVLFSIYSALLQDLFTARTYSPLLKDTFLQRYFLASIQRSSRTLYAPKGLFMLLKDTFLAVLFSIYSALLEDLFTQRTCSPLEKDSFFSVTFPAPRGLQHSSRTCSPSVVNKMNNGNFPYSFFVPASQQHSR